MIASAPISTPITSVQAQDEDYFFTLHLMVPKGNVQRQQVGEIMTEELPKIGIDVEMHIVDFSEFLPRMYKVRDDRQCEGWGDNGYDLYLVQFGFGVSPQGMMLQFGSNSSWQCSGYRNGNFDTLMEKAGKTVGDEEKREKLYWKASEIIYHDLPIAPYWRIEGTYPLRTAAEGFNPPLSTDNLWEWTLPGEDNIHYVQPSDADNLNPYFMGTGYSARAVEYPVYDNLVALDENYRPKAGREGLAKSWEWINDTYIEFELYENATWHDGEPVMADDVAFTFNAVLDPETKAQEYTDFIDAGLEKAVVVDDYIVGMKIGKPYAPFMVEVGTNVVLPKHILKDVAHEQWMYNFMNTGVNNETGKDKFPIGSGPYKMTEWVEDDHITLEAHDDYHLGAPQMDTIYMDVKPESEVAFAALEAGEVDILNMWYGWTPETLNSAEENPDLTVATAPVLGAQQLGFNLQHPILSNRFVRWAINYMIPREQIIEDVCGGYGKPTSQYLPEGMLGHNPNLAPVTYSVEDAKEMMELGGYDYEYLEEKGAAIPLWFWAIPIVTFVVGLAGAYVALRRMMQVE
ncbi:MAG: hypothetical protein GWO20_19455 [Candidatus Korarchaeota archaeon]|nr:hypothetical protein [Candidatus Korarchaeota archaeon]NIU83655.1 hypothetical protein [Candidatus Thorarchaeota archaeon]NIW15530.1 hypothetical protein [Candidatus Thorarchaeota archaeon]NIW53476.1 hypothetical protein [Candidatus Korarchaeota archaeon]